MDTKLVNELAQKIMDNLSEIYHTSLENAPGRAIYGAVACVIKDMLRVRRLNVRKNMQEQDGKAVYYLSMEFLMGRSLKNGIYNLGIQNEITAALNGMGVDIEELYGQEPDAGLGNGGLGRLAACYMDALATRAQFAMGYSILYEYGIFRQRIVEGWQVEEPDDWLPGGEVWLTPVQGRSVEVRFGGRIDETFDGNYIHVSHHDYQVVRAVPYDMYVSGYGEGSGATTLRLWKAEAAGIDMELFNKGDYRGAMEQNSLAEIISKVLYPNDSNTDGKILRLRQQYFMVAASIGDILHRWLQNHKTLDGFSEKVAIHINDTHPTLAVPELMRVLLDECGFGWDEAWKVVNSVFAYTNHTVLPEALEVWDQGLLSGLLPRIYTIIREIDNRMRRDLANIYGRSQQQIEKMAVLGGGKVRMANLAVWAGHSVNGVSRLHSDIIKNDLFNDFFQVSPDKFTNVTNGIASRRWLYQANPELTKFICELIGDGFLKDMTQMEKLTAFAGDEGVLRRWGEIKHNNKLLLCDYIFRRNGVAADPSSMFDVQVKRLHEYKRQHMNALDIARLYLALKANPELPVQPVTFIFGAKAAPGYVMAKKIIKFINSLASLINRDPAVREKLRIVFLEDYNVTVSEMLMPASELSEQISLAGTEASGTGNMKLMLNGAVTLGTMDGANVEIFEAVGGENIIIFGMDAQQAASLKKQYTPLDWYNRDAAIKEVVDFAGWGLEDGLFSDIANLLMYKDQYMVLADFHSYGAARGEAMKLYGEKPLDWQRMSLINTAKSGVFSADRAIDEYARNIWRI